MPPPQTPLLAVDCVVIDGDGRVLMVRRRYPPYQGSLALPGGFVEIGETVEAAARRELKEETSVKANELALIGVYSDPGRDPRGHVCSVAFLARVDSAETQAKAGDDAEAIAWLGDWRGAELAFDHRQIIADAFELIDQTRRPG